MKASLWAFIFSALLVFTAKAQQPALSASTNALASNIPTSLAEIRANAEKGDAAAQLSLGACYFLGRNGVGQDYSEAVKWTRKAAEQNCAPAQAALGDAYAIGHGVEQNDVEAVKWSRKAAEQNDSHAQCCLGDAYAFGRGGLAKDDVEAVKWYRKAADQGNAGAQCNLGVIYTRGDGVSQDYSEAVKWYRKAAEQGDADGQYGLGFCYAFGNGVIKDFVQAYKWDNLASAQGVTNAKRLLAFLEKGMTPDQIAEGQHQAREFKPGNAELPTSLPNATTSNSPTSSGTGFFITDDGYLISNYHVVKDAVQIRLLTSVGLISAKVVRVDSANDLALLKADGHFAPLPITASRAVKLGGTVATVGFPDIGLQGFAPKFARGEIASLSGAADDARYFQISVPVQPGNSGGALLDEHGNVVGVVSAKLNASVALAATGALPENVNYAVKSSFLLSFLESMPEVLAKLKEPVSAERKFDDVVQSAQAAAVLVLGY